MNLYFSFQWYTIDECDQRCKHCYIFSGGNVRLCTVTLLEIERILGSCLSVCRDFHRTPYFYITGGDSILSPHIWEFARMLHDRGVLFIVIRDPFHFDVKSAGDYAPHGAKGISAQSTA